MNGRRAHFTRSGDEIRVTPRDTIRDHRTFSVTVTYGGVPEALNGPIVFGSDYGWMKTDDGVFVACEPNAASTWFPSSDHPSDKATYDIRIKAPKGLTGVSNGRLVDTYDVRGGQTVHHWRESRPMATYLATASIGKFDVQTGRTPSGIPIYVAIDPVLKNSNNVDVYGVTAEVTDYWSKVFGPYPFEETGAVVDDMPQAGFSWRRSPSRATPPSAPRARSCTSWPTSGSATPSRCGSGRTSGSTRASPVTGPGCGTSTRAAPAPTTPSSPPTTPSPRPRPSGRASSPTRSATPCSTAPSTTAAR